MATLTSPAHVSPPASAAAPIELSALTHSYGSRRALDALTFTVHPAEIFGLLGPNGSGKTTLFRILSTLMTPSAGSARIAGFDVAREANRVRQQIGIVFQARSVDIKLTVRENLMHQGHLYGLRGPLLKRRIDKVLGRVLLRDRANDPVETLSGGMQRRVELAKGLIHSPSVLLLDEPSTGLDPGARRDLWQYLRTLRDEDGVSVLVTTHLMEEAEHCDRLAILNAGRLVALGSPAELRSSVGGDVVLLDAATEAQASELAGRVAQRFFVAPTVHGLGVRLEHPQGHRFVTQVIEAFPGLVEGIRVAKPSLEDVFIQRTGHRFWTEVGPEAEPDARTRAENAMPATYKEPL